MKSAQVKNIGIGAGLIALFFLHAFLAWAPIHEFSPTYDESIHIASGFSYWKTADYGLNGYHHPPLSVMWATLPLLSLNPILPTQSEYWIRHDWSPQAQYRFADLFLFHNRISADRMVSAARLMQIPLSMLLGLCLFIAAARWKGWKAGLTAAMLWAVCPNFLMEASLVSTDYAFAIFFFLFFALEAMDRGWTRYVLRGLMAGCCVASKYFAISMAPILCAEGAVLIFCWLRERKKTRKPLPIKSWLMEAVVILTVSLVVLNAIFQFQGLDIWWQGVTNLFSRSQAGRSSYFWGQRYTQGHVLYFPGAFLIKTPLPLLISVVPLAILLIRKEISIPLSWWLPPTAFFAIACASKVQIGLRYILCVYPFLILIVAGTLSQLKNKWKLFSWGMLVWSAVATWLVRPNYLAYFNELVGGPGRGYHYLTDSNVDWGQGLKMLAKNLEPADLTNGIYLNYFGTADPHAYGIKYLDLGGDSLLTGHVSDWNQNLQPTKFAISVTNLQATYYADAHVYDWVKRYLPWKVIAHSIFVYDFSKNPEALERLRAK